MKSQSSKEQDSAPKFDNFESYIKFAKNCGAVIMPDNKLGLETPDRLKNEKERESYVWYRYQSMLHAFCMHYYNPFGYNFLKEQISKLQLSNENQILLNTLMSDMSDYVEKAVKDFDSYLTDIDEIFEDLELNEDICRNYVAAITINEVYKFICEQYNSRYIKDWHLILAYFAYDSGVNYEFSIPTFEYVCTQLQMLYNKLSKWGGINDLTTFFINGVIKANESLKNYDTEFEAIFEISVKDNRIASSGVFIMSAKYIKFNDGFVWIYHPKHPTGEDGYLPLRYELKESRSVYSNISDYITKKLPPILVEANDGRIVKLIGDIQLKECIELIERYTNKPKIAKNQVKPKVERKDLSKQETQVFIRDLKSRYLDYLCASQLDEYKVVCCIEQRITESGACEKEYSFIFTINSDHRKTILVYENAKALRSTYIIEIDTSRYDGCIDNIFAYFASDILNKRQKMANGELNIAYNGIQEMHRIYHKDYLKWCESIQSYRCK